MLSMLTTNIFFPVELVTQFLYSFKNTTIPIIRNSIPKQTATIGLVYKPYPSLILKYLCITLTKVNNSIPNTP